MNELQIFNNPEFGEIRTLEKNGGVWFCLVDVCRSLGIKSASDCKGRLNLEGVVIADTPTSGGVQPVNFINESNLYKVIFQSHKPKAEQFTEWVTGEVLPSLRHTGTYTIQPMTTAEQLVAQAQLLLDMEKELKAVTERVETAETFAIEAGAKAEQAVQKLDTAIKVYSRPDKDHWVEDMELAIRELATSDGWGEVRLRGQLYRELELSAHKDISARLKRLRDRKRQAGMTYKEAAALTKLDAIAASKELRLIFEGIVKRHQAETVTKQD